MHVNVTVELYVFQSVLKIKPVDAILCLDLHNDASREVCLKMLRRLARSIGTLVYTTVGTNLLDAYILCVRASIRFV